MLKIVAEAKTVWLERFRMVVDRLGIPRVILEDAAGFFESFGFSYCGPFADYNPDPNSVFMELDL